MKVYKDNLVRKNFTGDSVNTHHLLIKNNYDSFIDKVWYFGTIFDGAQRQYFGARTNQSYGIFLIFGYGGILQLYSRSNDVWTLYNVNRQSVQEA